MITLFFIFIFIFGLCWGSFLNVVGYRLVAEKSLLTLRSACPSCEKIILWYDLIPIISWIVLRGRCRMCKAFISWLYPFIELSTASIITLLFQSYYPFFSVKEYLSFFVYVFFFSALLVSTRTDLESMVVYQITTLWLVPLGWIFSYLGLTAISVTESIIGTMIGYGFLLLVGFLFKYATGREGVGYGDFEILALIGSFLGPLGVWFSMLIGSCSGLLFVTPYLFYKKKLRSTRIPFVPFLLLGALIFFFCEQLIVNFFF